MKRGNGERGFVIVLALIAIMVMSFFLVTGASTTTSAIKVSGNYNKTIDVFNIAEVGIARARPLIEAAPSFNSLLATYQSTPLATGAFGSGTYSVTVADDADDANALSDSNNIIVVTSSGQTDMGSKVEIKTYLQRITTLQFPAGPPGNCNGGSTCGTSALMCGTSTDVRTQGSGGVTGHDYQVPTQLTDTNTADFCSGAACNGTNLTGSAAACTSQYNTCVSTYGTTACQSLYGNPPTCQGGYAVSGQGTVNATGNFISTRTPAVNQNVGAGANCSEWVTLQNQLTVLAAGSNVVYLTGSGTNAPLNDCTNPKVFVINTTASTYEFGGTATACGIVVVKSATNILATGTPTIVGLVLVMSSTAELDFTAGSGTPNFFGQIIVNSVTADTQKELDFKGNVWLKYSSEALQYAAQAMASGGSSGSLRTVSWEEKY